MSKLLFSLGIIASGLLLGYVLQIMALKGIISLPLVRLRRLLQKIGLLFFMSVSFVAAIWVVRVENLRIAALPFLCLLALTEGGILALAAARWFKMTRKQTGAYIVCGSFTNLGSVGGLLALVFLGEPGFALIPLYKLFEEMFYYTVGFPVAKYYSQEAGGGDTLAARLKRTFSDVFIITALASVILGTALNLSGLPRPGFMAAVTAVFVPAGTLLLLISIGLAMRLGSIRDYLKEGAAIAFIKSLLVPLTMGLAAWALGLKDIDGGLPFKVVLITASMPSAFVALVPPSIYDLDIDLANAAWLVSTASLIIVLPALYMTLQIL